ncbi:T-lymphocyte activation antigen CD86 isoform X2 [Rousettus aegyptiacus]|uniref:T-lymphocyte activation antigen CD86 isoform X2 n=1 Tax=Rousettus aegyptiacus TaxID=9407 RepID=UPI00168D79B4|nr:T-lymphocyte activation antigen CD86 isoform X2 [Rousettus aegyptiacus]
MGICESTMELSKTLFVIALLLSGAASMKSQAYFNETGDLPCHFTNSQNISLDELVVFWQNQDKLVLYELFKGKENPQNVHPKYKGRTSFDQDNWALRLHNVQIKDTGTYQCFIHRKRPQGLVSIHQMSSDLSVLANFSRPEIMIISNRTENSDTINLTCSSIQGYPKPKKMSFVLKTENSTTEYDVVMNIFQNNFTDLYNVSISLSISVSPKRNVSIFCVLQPESTKIQLVSQPYNIDAKPPMLPPPAPDRVLTVALLLLFIFVCGVVFLILMKRKRKQPGPSRECEANNMEERESEQGKERVENRASERFDKVQCDVNTSTTASDSVAVMRSKETSSSFREEEKHKHNR